MNTTITAVEDGETITNPTAEMLARWALARHLETCGSCRHEYCPAGSRYFDAVQPDRSWIPTHATEA